MSAVVHYSICLLFLHRREMCRAVRPSRILLMIAPKGSVVRELDVRSESRPCQWRGESSRRPCLRWRVDVI
jgi:hypothetical protein